jgi:hypothetical protein
VHVFSWYMQIHPGHALLEGRKPALLDSLVQVGGWRHRRPALLARVLARVLAPADAAGVSPPRPPDPRPLPVPPAPGPRHPLHTAPPHHPPPTAQAFSLAPLFVWYEALFLLGYRPHLRRQLQARVNKELAALRAGREPLLAEQQQQEQ